MNAENPSASRFQVVTETHLPHRCLACWKDSTGKNEFVDFGLSLDKEDPLFIGVPDSSLGAIYLCIDCARELAASIGALSPENTKKVSEDIVGLQDQLAHQERENERLRILNESYLNVLNSLGAVVAPSEQAEESGDLLPEGPVEGSAESDNGLAEPSAK